MRALKASGAIELGDSGYVVTKSVKRRLEKGRTGHVTSQHYDLQEKDVYLQNGAKRSARVNTRLSALDRLAHRTDIDGRPILQSSFVEAGKHLARDYNASGHGLTTTQHYDGASVDGGQSSNNSCLDQSLDMVERTEKWAKGSGLTLLKMGLSRLADHYGTVAGIHPQYDD